MNWSKLKPMWAWCLIRDVMGSKLAGNGRQFLDLIVWSNDPKREL